MLKRTLIISTVVLMCLTGCSSSNKNVDTITTSSQKVIERFVEVKPECKDLGTVCNEQIAAINNVCQETIRAENSVSWKSGFFTGIVGVLATLIILAVLLRKVLK